MILIHLLYQKIAHYIQSNIGNNYNTIYLIYVWIDISFCSKCQEELLLSSYY